MGTPRIQFRAYGALLEALEQRMDHPRRSRDETARRDLERYYALLETSLPQFEREEALLLADVLNGHLTLDPRTARFLWAAVEDAIRIEHADQRHGVDGASLVARLRALTPFEQLAIIDAVERAWNASPAYHVEDLFTRLVQVGLVAPQKEEEA